MFDGPPLKLHAVAVATDRTLFTLPKHLEQRWRRYRRGQISDNERIGLRWRSILASAWHTHFQSLRQLFSRRYRAAAQGLFPPTTAVERSLTAHHAMMRVMGQVLASSRLNVLYPPIGLTLLNRIGSGHGEAPERAAQRPS
jgi:hypothetical protein